jgi:glycosyltransferase involved in cell wall biosynthesis
VVRVAVLRDNSRYSGWSMRLYAENLVRGLSARGFEVRDVAAPAPPAPAPLPRSLRRVEAYLARYWRQPRRLRGLQADLYHVVDHANAHWLRVLPAQRSVVTCHDLILLKLAAGQIRWRGRRPAIATRAFRWSVAHLPLARAVLCVSESTRRDALELLGCAPERLHLIPQGLDPAFRPLARDEARARFGGRVGWGDWPATLLHVGPPSFYKNLEGLLEALALLPPPWRERVHLVKAGDDFTDAQRRLAERRGLAERIHYVGALALADLVLLYNSVDALVFPSLYEGFGWPPLEAMACGTPVVSSDRGGLREVVADASCLVDPEDPRDLARGVVQVLEDAALREVLRRRGSERARAFSWERAFERIQAVYAAVLASEAPQARTAAGGAATRRPRVLIAHPGRQHSHQTALAFQEAGLLDKYLTPFWYDARERPYLYLDRVPRPLRQPLLAQLRKRSFEPLRSENVGTYSLARALPLVLARLDRRRLAGAMRLHRLGRAFDRWVAEKIERQSVDAFVGYEGAALECFRVCRRRGIPSVLDLAGVHWAEQDRVLDEERRRDAWPDETTPALEREIRTIKDEELALADLVLTPSQLARASLLAAGLPAGKVAEVPYGVDLEAFQPKPAYPRDGPFTVLYVGAIRPAKGLRYLLEAFVPLAGRQAQLLLIGGMAGAERILADYAGSYRHLPFLTHDVLVRHYQQADVFVFPSLLDSFGLVVLEAMACGTPVILSDRTGARDVVRDGVDGFIVPSRDAAALGDRIRLLLERRQLTEELGHNARRQALKYPWQVYRDRVRKLVGGLIRPGSRRADASP